MALALIFLGLAVWRVTFMLVKEKGPLDIFARLRAKLANHQERSGGLFDLISCFYCVSMWIGAVFALFLAQSLLTWFIYTLILSTEAIFIQVVMGKLNYRV